MTAIGSAAGDGPCTSPDPSLTLGATTNNNISNGTFTGPVVQARAVLGGIHVHEATVVPPTPRQLLAVPAAFTDRDEDLAGLVTQVRALPDYAVRIVVINGPGGIGKTTLANRLLQLLTPEYPGGQLYADLRGYAPEGPARTDEILSRFLRALLPGAQPASTEELAAWWRSATASRQPAGILLDNARNATQLLALLPGGSGHLVVATSRDPLAELAPDGAVLHRLGPFDQVAAQQYLTRCLGEQRVAREPDAAARITRLSAGSPMAIALTVTQLAADPARTLAEVTSLTADPAPPERPHRQLPRRQQVAVTEALDRAYWSLPRDTATPAVYSRMASTFALDFDGPLTAAVCNLTRSSAEGALETLHTLNLIELAGEDTSRGRVYRFHDIAREHARNRAAREATFGEPEEILQRAVDFYLATASEAEQILTRAHRPLRRDYVYRPAEPVVFHDNDGALAWLYAQRHNLLPAIRAAAGAGLDRSTWQLTHAIWPLLRSSHDYGLWFESHELGLQAARRCGDREAEVEMLSTWGVGLRGAGAFDEAARTFTAALQLAREEQDRRAEAQALHELGAVNLYDGRPSEAEGFLLQAREKRTQLGRASESERDRSTFSRAVAITDICLGQAQLELGRPTEAIETLTAARTTLLAVPDPLDAARALAWLGRAHTAGGDPATGVADGRRAVAECNAAGSARWRAQSKVLLGHTHRENGQTGLARGLYEEALGIYAAVSRRDEERVRRYLADIA